VAGFLERRHYTAVPARLLWRCNTFHYFQNSNEFQPFAMNEGSISIVVPTYNEAVLIRSFLRQLRERAPGAEIIVVDGGSNDNTREQTAGLRDQMIVAKQSRGGQMNAGAAVASEAILWFLHADCEVPSGCLDEIADALQRPRTVGGFFRIRIPSNRVIYRLTDSFAHYAGQILRIRCSDHGFFCRRSAFEQVGGFPELPLMEDAEFFRKLRRLGRIAIIPSRLISSPRRYEDIGPWRLTLTYGLIGLLYFLRVPIPILARIYYKTCARRK
jgi:rSAM/selenodomain-associated transferase 2